MPVTNVQLKLLSGIPPRIRSEISLGIRSKIAPLSPSRIPPESHSEISQASFLQKFIPRFLQDSVIPQRVLSEILFGVTSVISSGIVVGVSKPYKRFHLRFLQAILPRFFLRFLLELQGIRDFSRNFWRNNLISCWRISSRYFCSNFIKNSCSNYKISSIKKPL